MFYYDEENVPTTSEDENLFYYDEANVPTTSEEENLFLSGTFLFFDELVVASSWLPYFSFEVLPIAWEIIRQALEKYKIICKPI